MEVDYVIWDEYSPQQKLVGLDHKITKSNATLMQYLLLDGTTFLPNIACIDYLVTCHVSAVGRMIHERSRRSKRTIKEEKRVEKGSYFPADDNMHYHMYLYGLFPTLIMNIYCSYLPFFIISFFFKVKL